MSKTSTTIDETLEQYIRDISLREHPVLEELRQVTAELEESNMQIAPEQGQFMAMLVRLIGARRTIEVGVFTGYSALAVALSLPDDGRVVACDVSEEWTRIGRQHWRKAGVEHRIDLRIAPALETLDHLLADGQSGTFDFAFIDADKLNYAEYYERCLRLVSPGGLIAIDNVLWDGEVVNNDNTEPETEAIRAMNRFLQSDKRVDISLVPIADGLTLARRRT
ncbi:MAG: class I SAM-dependent methyltransferase [Rhodothermia bacterium]|nr:class I SAM-dependent methyltransferase [Rhodothermia bacterium]